jgi:N-acetylmuramoyl-L-alanine amidase
MHIFLDAGHGGKDPGASFRDLHEKDLALTLTLLIGGVLVHNGHRVSYSRVDDTFIPLGERVRLANAAQVDRVISIHLNADADPDAPGMHEARGSEALYATPRGLHVARKLEKAFSRIHDLPWRGCKERRDLYVLRRTQAPAVLLEVGFIDSEKDLQVLRHPDLQEWLALLIARAVVQP